MQITVIDGSYFILFLRTCDTSSFYLLCWGHGWISEEGRIFLFCGTLLRLLFIFLWHCKQRRAALRKLRTLACPLLLLEFFLVDCFVGMRILSSNPTSLFLLLCHSIYQCKHQLAARLAASLGACVDVKVSDKQLAVLLSKLWLF